MDKFLRYTRVNTSLLLFTITIILINFVIDEVKIQELQQKQSHLIQINDSITLESKTKDSTITKLKSILKFYGY